MEAKKDTATAGKGRRGRRWPHEGWSIIALIFFSLDRLSVICCCTVELISLRCNIGLMEQELP